MLKVTKRRFKKERRIKRIFLILTGIMIIFFSGILVLALQNVNLTKRLSYQVCYLMLRQFSPNLMEYSRVEYYEDSESSYETRTESDIHYERILAQNVGVEDASDIAVEPEEQPLESLEKVSASATERTVISREKLNDFDYLIQNFYTVDRTTTINSSQLNAQELLARDCSIVKRQDEEPQILIYHTHASETYIDSVPGDLSTTVVGVGQRLSDLLENTYGYHVYHDTGVYDTERDRAYSVAEPYIRKILDDHPSIEVVIDLHRDAVGEQTRLVTEQGGVQMAKIMFFNGLSRTTAVGDIEYLPNPYIHDNLAISLQMQIAAREMYPDFTRNIYLKGYRYNMHFLPKSLLIEVGAQTNTLEEAMNAMEPLAKVLNEVLSGN